MLSLQMDGHKLIQLQYKSTKTRFKRPTMEAKLPLLFSLIHIRQYNHPYLLIMKKWHKNSPCLLQKMNYYQYYSPCLLFQITQHYRPFLPYQIPLLPMQIRYCLQTMNTTGISIITLTTFLSMVVYEPKSGEFGYHLVIIWISQAIYQNITRPWIIFSFHFPVSKLLGEQAGLFGFGYILVAGTQICTN